LCRNFASKEDEDESGGSGLGGESCLPISTGRVANYRPLALYLMFQPVILETVITLSGTVVILP